MKSPIVVDKLVIKLNDEPNNLSGISNETGFPGSKVAYSSVVVGIFFVVGLSTSQAKPFEAGFCKKKTTLSMMN